MSKQSEIGSFYAGKTVFLTGGTGFLGKALIEKLLYSCEDISKIYVLVRTKKGKTPEERIQHMIDVPEFSRLKSRLNCLSKLIPISGDLSKLDLGISKESIKCLEDEVSVVFHLAATVNFSETLKEAMDVNATGTIQLIKLCHRMKNLQVTLVHMSTAYSNADRSDIDEVVYPTSHSYEQAQQIADTSSGGAHCLEGKPNSYTYSKALAENIILETRGAIPTAIVRPSIVISSLKEPCPGWIDNWNGATGYFVGMSSGVLRVAIGRSWNVADFIPVDIVTNLTIVAAARCQRSNKLKVYNCCSGKSNPITYREALNISRKITFEHSLNDLPWPFLLTTSSHTVYYILNLFLHILPAFLADLWSVFVGRPSRNMKIQMKLMKMVHALKHFVLNEWNFSDGNVRELWKSLTSCDQELFNFDVKSIIWERCFEDYLLGARKFLLKK